MKSREKVVRAIQFQDPDTLPISHAILPSAQYRYGKKLSEIIDSFHEDFGWHLLPDLPREKLPHMYKSGRHPDDFGTLWHVTVEGRCGIPVEYPIKPDLSGYNQYRWPEIFSAGVPKYRLYSGHMAGMSEDYYARGGWIVFFEQMQQLVGFENLLVALSMGMPAVFNLRDDPASFNIGFDPGQALDIKLIDASGKDIPVQLRDIERYNDNSLRWKVLIKYPVIPHPGKLNMPDLFIFLLK